MRSSIKKILREEEREKMQTVSLKASDPWPEFRKQNAKRSKDALDASIWELLIQGLEIEEEEFEEPQVIKDLNALIKAIEEGKKDNYLMRTKNFKRLNLDKDKLAFWRNHLNKPEVKSVWARAKGKIQKWLDGLEKDSTVAVNENQLKRHIKKILREEYYHSSYTPDKWDLLERDLKKYIDKLITDHKQNFHNDQYAVISAIEDILEGMFARVNR